MKRLFDLFSSLIALFIFSPILLMCALLIKLTSKGPAIHWSKRIGRDNIIFLMPKFRTMRIETPQVATHLLKGEDYVTPVGKFLRKTSLDELPQLWSIFVGDMSVVGPRPALFNQDDLISLRTLKGIHKIKPGLTGWAQINGRDDLPIPIKVIFDYEYLNNQSITFDFKIIFLTFLKVLRSEGVKH